jgi:hypothetical protein
MIMEKAIAPYSACFPSRLVWYQKTAPLVMAGKV